MKVVKKWMVRGALSLVALLVVIGGGWIASLPPAPAYASPPPIAQAETDATLAALKPPKRARPLIAIVGINEATEATDYLMPYGILRRADVADVMALATGAGVVKLYPALTVMPDATLAAFDAQHSAGADYVIVPAMSRDDDPAVLQWIRSQADKGAIIIAVCAGAKVAGAAGLLDGRRATTHWYYLEQLLDRNPSIRAVADRRFVVDGRVATTTGITASMPMSLTLIEAIAGRQKAEAVARDLGLASWDARHDSSAFRFNRPFAMTVIGNRLAFWNREEFGLQLTPGIDEVALALVADAWSRTYRSSVVTFAGTAVVETRSGIRIVADRMTSEPAAGPQLPAIQNLRAAEALDGALDAMATRYGRATASVVAMQLEYPRREDSRTD